MLIQCRQYIWVLFVFMICVSSAWADEVSPICQEKHDQLVCGAGRLDQLKYLGDAVLNGTTVTGSTNITGDLALRHATLSDVKVVGDLEANDTHVNGTLLVKGDAVLSQVSVDNSARIVGDAKAAQVKFNSDTAIIGDLNCDTCAFKQTLRLAANHADLASSSTKSILFDPSDKNQMITIHSNSTVEGDIQFTRSGGTVNLSKDSLITGIVKNGVIVHN